MARSDLKRAESILAFSAARVGAIIRRTVVVRSPKAGRVLKLYRESEGAVAMGEPVMDIGDAKDIEVRVELLSADAVKIKPGTPVSFERWGGRAALKGKVRTIEPSGFTKISSLGVEEQRVLVIARYQHRNPKPASIGRRLPDRGGLYRLGRAECPADSRTAPSSEWARNGLCFSGGEHRARHKNRRCRSAQRSACGNPLRDHGRRPSSSPSRMMRVRDGGRIRVRTVHR